MLMFFARQFEKDPWDRVWRGCWRISFYLCVLFQLSFFQAHGHPPNDAQKHVVSIEHDEAVRLGLEIGLGRVRAVSPNSAKPLVAAAYDEFAFEYETGRNGIERGGHIRAAMRHVFHWSLPQTSDPLGEGYVTVSGPDGVEFEIVPWPGRSDARDLFLETFPWQHSIELRIVAGRLNEGDIVRVTYGAMEHGGPGARIQPSEEEAYAFRFYVNPEDGSTSLPLERDVTFDIVGATATRLSLVAQSGVEAQLTVRAEDQFGNLDPGFDCSITLWDLQGRVVWTGHMDSGHGGVLTVDIARQPSNQTDRYTATGCGFIARSNPLQAVDQNTGGQVFWGDLHGHTLASDGRGTIERFYTYCRDVAALDFCAVTDHGFQITNDSWAKSKRMTEAFNEAGSFVTLQSYEWSGLTDVGGDHNIFFRASDPPIFRSRSYYDERNQQAYHGDEGKVNFIGDLHAKLLALGERNVMSVPHFGGRAASSQWHEPKIERLVEIFSEHGRKHDWAYEFLQRGYRLGLIASTDNHTGRPGYGFLRNPFLSDPEPVEVGAALVGVVADDLNRDSIFDALYERHVYATTGDRILLRFEAGAALMGDEIESDEMPELRVKAIGVEPLRRIDVIRDGQIVHTVALNTLGTSMAWDDPSPVAVGDTAAYWVRVVQANDEEAVSSPIWWTRTGPK